MCKKGGGLLMRLAFAYPGFSRARAVDTSVVCTWSSKLQVSNILFSSYFWDSSVNIRVGIKHFIPTD